MIKAHGKKSSSKKQVHLWQVTIGIPASYNTIWLKILQDNAFCTWLTHALPTPPPPPLPTGFTLTGALQRVLTILESGDQNLSNKHGISHPPKSWVAQTLASALLIESHNLSMSLTIS